MKKDKYQRMFEKIFLTSFILCGLVCIYYGFLYAQESIRIYPSMSLFDVILPGAIIFSSIFLFFIYPFIAIQAIRWFSQKLTYIEQDSKKIGMLNIDDLYKLIHIPMNISKEQDNITIH